MQTRFAVPALLAASLFAFGCNKSDGATPAATTDDDAGAEAPLLGGSRPVAVQAFRVPAGYDPAKPAPLVMVLHGFGASGIVQNMYFHLYDIADQEGFFLIAPDGKIDSKGRRFWNATDACCDFDHTNVDDVAYLTGLVDEIKGRYAIDPKRVFLVGHSNGGFMSYRLACDRADTFAAIVSLAGATWKDTSKCTPQSPVSVLQIHGTADDTVAYDGGTIPTSLTPNDPVAFPGAVEDVNDWASNDGCSPTPDTSAPNVDFANDVAGAESAVTRWQGCQKASGVELWSMADAGHIPDAVKDVPTLVWGFLKAHPKP